DQGVRPHRQGHKALGRRHERPGRGDREGTGAGNKHGGWLMRKEKQEPGGEVWELRLYVAGETPRSVAALTNLRRICEEHLAGKYTIEVIDLLERPQLARGEQIVAIPTLERRLPEPVRKIIGDLSNTERVLI